MAHELPAAAAWWRPDALCAGLPAHERATWLTQEKGLAPEAARRQVVAEFPSVFPGAANAVAEAWSPEAVCDGCSAEERSKWLVANRGMAVEQARVQVMREFPLVFGDRIAAALQAGPHQVASPLVCREGATAPVQEAAAANSSGADGDEPNPPVWPDSVKILNRSTGYAAVDEIYAEMAAVDRGQFSQKRYAIMFEPAGTVHEVDVRVGYYTSVYGLGLQPGHTRIRSVTCTNETSSPELGSLQNFWRSAENFQTGEHPTYGLNGRGGMLWAVSQAAPLRRVVVEGNIFLWYFRMPPPGVTASDGRYPAQGACLEYPGWQALGIVDPFGDFASGGYMANVSVKGLVDLGSQQQFFFRNCDAQGYTGGSWNFVFVGCPGAQQSDEPPLCSAIAEVPIVAEKPFVVKQGPRYKLVVPRIKAARVGVDFSVEDSEVRDFSRVVLVTPTSSIAAVNAKLAAGKDAVFAPGIYHLTESLVVGRTGQVLLGLGFATLVSPAQDLPCILVRDGAADVRVSGFMLEAAYRPLEDGAKPGALASNGPRSLLQWGGQASAASSHTGSGHAGSSWSIIHDCFARVGGQEAPYTAVDEATGSRPTTKPQCGSPLFPTEARCESMVRIDSPRVVGDNLWLWRADHWLSDQYLVYNHENFCSTGLRVGPAAREVRMYGLFVEHVLGDMTVWEGEDGATYFYQSELPYDAMPSAVAASRGFSPFCGVGYRVADTVHRHEAHGVGVYAFFRDHDVTVAAGVRAPARAGVVVRNALTKFLNGGPARYVPGEAVLRTEKLYGRIECVLEKGGVRHGPSTDSDKDATHCASG